MGRASRKGSTDVLFSNFASALRIARWQYFLTRAGPSLYHCWPRWRARFCFTAGCNSEGDRMDSTYSTWIGQPVVLHVALGELRVPVRGKLLRDGGETLRMRIGEGWDVDIYKTMVLAVEEDAMALLPA